MRSLLVVPHGRALCVSCRCCAVASSAVVMGHTLLLTNLRNIGPTWADVFQSGSRCNLLRWVSTFRADPHINFGASVRSGGAAESRCRGSLGNFFAAPPGVLSVLRAASWPHRSRCRYVAPPPALPLRGGCVGGDPHVRRGRALAPLELPRGLRRSPPVAHRFRKSCTSSHPLLFAVNSAVAVAACDYAAPFPRASPSACGSCWRRGVAGGAQHDMGRVALLLAVARSAARCDVRPLSASPLRPAAHCWSALEAE